MDDVDRMVGEIIREKRKLLKWTQVDLAARVGTTAQSIYYYEKGLRGIPMSMFFKFCNALDLSPNDIQKEITGRRE